MMRQRDVTYKKCLRTINSIIGLLSKNTETGVYRLFVWPSVLFFTDNAHNDPAKIWRQVKTSSGLGRNTPAQHPWPCSTRATSKVLADMLNQHFVLTVESLFSQHQIPDVNSSPVNSPMAGSFIIKGILGSRILGRWKTARPITALPFVRLLSLLSLKFLRH